MANNILKKIAKEENGNVLYMAVMLLMVLVLFFFLLVNAIYIGVTKIKAQNAADNLALSAATLKARFLNDITDINAVLYVFLEFGTVSKYRPYATGVEAWIAQGAMTSAYVLIISKLIPEYQSKKPWLDKILEGNGIVSNENRAGIHPFDIKVSDPWNIINLIPFGNRADLGIISEELACAAPSFLLPMPIMAFEPTYTWFVQSRVEISTNKSLIGGDRLGMVLPDIIARSRAEVFDKGIKLNFVAPHAAHNWRVRLSQPEEDVDLIIRQKINSENASNSN